MKGNCPNCNKMVKLKIIHICFAPAMIMGGEPEPPLDSSVRYQCSECGGRLSKPELPKK